MIIIGPDCHEDGIHGYGDPDNHVMIIGIAPGYDEMRTGKPFTGRSGQLLDSVLKGVGFERDKVYTTNLICTRNDEPSVSQIISCSNRLQEEIKLVQPKLIITLGEIAQNAFLPEYTLGKIRGIPVWSERYNSWILCTYHPAAALRKNFFVHDIIKDLDKIYRILSFPDKTGFSDIKYSVATSKLDAQEYINSLDKDKYTTLDVETKIGKDADGNIDVYNDELLVVGIGNSEHAMVIPEKYTHGLTWPKLHYGGHNFVFDVQMVRRFLDVTLPIKWDTFLASYLLDERRGGHGLGYLVPAYLGTGFYKQEVDRRRLDKANEDDLNLYNAKDVVYNSRLAEYLIPKLFQDNVQDVYYKLLLPATNMFADVIYRGIHVEHEVIKKLGLEWGQKFLDEDKELQQLAIANGWDKPEININSPQQLSRLLYKIMKLPGGPSTAKPVIEDLALNNAFIARVVAIRHLYHLFTTYIAGTQDDIKFDSRVHPSVWLTGQVAGRTSYTDPPMQTLPKNLNPDDPVEEAFSKYDKVIKDFYPDYNLLDGLGQVRKMFTATNDDYVIVEADYKGAELYAAVAYSGDENLKADLLSGDFHTNAAKRYFRTETPSSYQRKSGKFVTFGRLNERQAYAISQAELRDWKLSEVKELVENFDRQYSKLTAFKREYTKLADLQGEVTGFTGRKRRPRLMLGDERQSLMNSIINFAWQSLANDTTLKAAIRIHKIFKRLKLDCYILMTFHDAIYFEMSKKDLQTGLKIAKTIMEKPQFKGCLSNPAEFHVGKSFGELEEINVHI